MLSLSPDEFLSTAQFPRGVGPGTLARLAALGLVEQGIHPGPSPRQGWKISAKGCEVAPEMKLEPTAQPFHSPTSAKGKPLAEPDFLRCCCPRNR